jgi:hypothetical protein
MIGCAPASVITPAIYFVMGFPILGVALPRTGTFFPPLLLYIKFAAPTHTWPMFA